MQGMQKFFPLSIFVKEEPSHRRRADSHAPPPEETGGWDAGAKP
jgi:hypothetical protein